jgi:tungstate transport system substrate-binding protein
MKRSFFFACSVFLISFLPAIAKESSASIIKMATTTSTENSGLLNVLLPVFTKQTGITIHVIAVGSGKAMKLGENGDVDLILVHARDDELQFVKQGFGVNRRDVMHNDFVIVGPKHDPARITGEKKAAFALGQIARRRAEFISRGDESGTHIKEKALWEIAGIAPSGPWYLQAGQGMEAVLTMANEKQAYTLADRGTFLAMESKLDLVVLCEGDSILYNPYGIIAVNPEKYPYVKYRGAMEFIDWITSKDGRALIAGFTVDGKQLFFPDAQ